MLKRRRANAEVSERQFLQAHSEREAGQKVLGVGSCGLDYLAVVARYPEPDAKLRTETLEVRPLQIEGEIHKPHLSLSAL